MCVSKQRGTTYKKSITVSAGMCALYKQVQSNKIEVDVDVESAWPERTQFKDVSCCLQRVLLPFALLHSADHDVIQRMNDNRTLLTRTPC